MKSWLLVMCMKAVYRPVIFLIPFLTLLLGPTRVKALVCPLAGPVISRIEATGVYQAGDKSHSNRSLVGWTKNNFLVAPTRHFQSTISTLADASPQDPVSRECLLSILRTWATGHAFLEAGTRQASYVQAWVLSTISLAILKSNLIHEIRQDVPTSDWLSKLQKQVINTFVRRKSENNLTYWGALAVMASAIIVGGPEALSIAERWYQSALDSIDAQGYLPEELERSSRALHYHFFAAQALYVYERVRPLAFGPRDLPSPLKRLLNLLAASPSLSNSRFPPQQVAPTETGWFSIYCHSAPGACKGSKYEEHEFIPRLGGRVDLLEKKLNVINASK